MEELMEDSGALLKDEPQVDTLYDPRLLDFVPSKVALGNRILPIGWSAGTLVCMAEEPDDPYLQSRVKFQLQRDVRLIPARAGFREALHEAYGGDPCPETEDLVSAVTQRREVNLTNRTRQGHRPWNASPKVVAVTSGKGGVGKTTLTANLGIALTQMGLQVGVVDCDFGLSNMHVMLGMRPVHRLPDVLQGRVALTGSFESGPGQLQVLAGATGSSELAELSYDHLEKGGLTTQALKGLFDITFLDTGAGIQQSVLSMLTNADEVLLVVTPDPPSVQDAYVTLRVLLEQKPTARVGFIVNEARDAAQAKDVAAKFQTFASLHLGCQLRYLGAISFDRAVENATRSRLPLVLGSPRSRAARDIHAVAERFAGLPSEGQNFFERMVARLSWD
ncbi:MAG: P-loop NTPase [Armatimonadetes bacterium]|nr:P-loop NTPase [Armatimonadota bacterium]